MNLRTLQLLHCESCVYCGEPADTRDHVPPLCISPNNRKTYPACRRCNCSILGNRAIPTLEERQRYVFQRLGLTGQDYDSTNQKKFWWILKPNLESVKILGLLGYCKKNNLNQGNMVAKHWSKGYGCIKLPITAVDLEV